MPEPSEFRLLTSSFWLLTSGSCLLTSPNVKEPSDPTTASPRARLFLKIIPQPLTTQNRARSNSDSACSVKAFILLNAGESVVLRSPPSAPPKACRAEISVAYDPIETKSSVRSVIICHLRFAICHLPSRFEISHL